MVPYHDDDILAGHHVILAGHNVGTIYTYDGQSASWATNDGPTSGFVVARFDEWFGAHQKDGIGYEFWVNDAPEHLRAARRSQHESILMANRRANQIRRRTGGLGFCVAVTVAELRELGSGLRDIYIPMAWHDDGTRLWLAPIKHIPDRFWSVGCYEEAMEIAQRECGRIGIPYWEWGTAQHGQPSK